MAAPVSTVLYLAGVVQDLRVGASWTGYWGDALALLEMLQVCLRWR